METNLMERWGSCCSKLGPASSEQGSEHKCAPCVCRWTCIHVSTARTHTHTHTHTINVIYIKNNFRYLPSQKNLYNKFPVDADAASQDRIAAEASGAHL